MKKYFNILFIFASLLFMQDTRSVIFNTGSPETLDNGYEISSSQSIANRISVSNNYVLEAMVFYMTLQEGSGDIIISMREDNNGIPGELVDELSTWNFTLDPMSLTGYNLIVTTDLCIYLDAGTYWWSIEAGEDDTTFATWVHSNGNLYQYALNDGDGWINQAGHAGAGGVWAEQIYDLPYDLGDVNFDFLINVVDIVLIVGHILDTNLLDTDVLEYADINSDATIDVVDLVQLINLILTESTPNPPFVLEDINPASEYHHQSIGPPYFEGQVSGYYFGKQGWSTCRARFGILNQLHAELVSEGIDDVKIMGINGYQYINDSLDCMICTDDCTSSTCDEGPRILPWTQDQDDGLNCQDENEGLCQASDDVSDIWDMWNITLRDFIILDRHGVEFSRVNLTYNNPDPEELGACSGNYQKIKDLLLAARNR